MNYYKVVILDSLEESIVKCKEDIKLFKDLSNLGFGEMKNNAIISCEEFEQKLTALEETRNALVNSTLIFQEIPRK